MNQANNGIERNVENRNLENNVIDCKKHKFNQVGNFFSTNKKQLQFRVTATPLLLFYQGY